MSELSLITDPWFYAVAIPAVISIGISKAGVGGSGAIAVPLMALAIPVPQAVAILLPIICLADIFAIWAFRRTWHKRNLMIMIPAATVGIIIGTLSFKYLDENAIKILIGLIAVAFASQQIADQVGNKLDQPPTQPNVTRGSFWSLASGFTAFVAHSGSVPLSVYMIPQRLDKSVYMGTLAIFYTYVNYAKIGPYWWLGQFNITNISTAVALISMVPLGIVLGLWMHRKFNEVLFYRTIVALLFLTGLKLLYDGFDGIL
ncbi:sulfite exporter TauE/SafE family protein [Pseudomonadota bacterium]